MSRHEADVAWTLKPDDDFLRGRYGRGHVVRFDGGVEVPASAAPDVVGKWADPAAVDPEEMLVAALASCHMLSFLHVARLAGFTVAAYRDHAEGEMGEIAPGRQAVTRVTLRPAIEWSGDPPDATELARLHDAAHEACFIANSVTTEIAIA